MDKAGYISVGYLFLLLIPLLYLPRSLQREIQGIFLLITHRPDISMVLFSLLFLPGVLLHEASHYLMARLLGVRTGKFSLVPKKIKDGRLQLGYVETQTTDFIRDSLIGAAPLFSGCIFIALVGAYPLEMNQLWSILSPGIGRIINADFKSMVDQPDFWLWFYLILTVSSTMMPSASDRKAWMPVLLLIVVVAVLFLLFGVGPWLVAHVGSYILRAVNTITIVFGITVFIHVVLLPPAWIIRKTISRITGYQVV
jgi:hypothetical protein